MAQASCYIALEGIYTIGDNSLKINGGWGYVGTVWPTSPQVRSYSTNKITITIPEEYRQFKPTVLYYQVGQNTMRQDYTTAMTYDDATFTLTLNIPHARATALGGNAYYTIKFSEVEVPKIVNYEAHIDKSITCNYSESSHEFAKGVTEFKFSLETYVGVTHCFSIDGKDGFIKFISGGVTEYIPLTYPYDNEFTFTKDIQSDFSIYAELADRPIAMVHSQLSRCKTNYAIGTSHIEVRFGRFPITFYANNNAEFIDNGSIVMRDIHTNEILFSDVIVPTDKKQFTYEFDNGLGGLVGNLEIVLVAKSTIVSANPMLNCYRVTDLELTSVAETRYEFFVSNGSIETITDKGLNIVKIMNIPFEIPEDKLIDGVINLGAFTTDIKTKVLKTYKIEFDIGSIEVPEKYKNTLDFLNTTAELYLPFVDTVTLPVSYVIGYTIKIEYLMNMYNGDATVNIYSSKVDNIPIVSLNKNISMDIPFLPADKFGVPQQHDLQELVNNNVEHAQIHIIRNVPVINEFGIPVNATDTLNKFHGYSEITEVNLNTSADIDEQYTIKQLLAQGVILP